MAHPRIYHPNNLQKNQTIALPDDAGLHVGVVLRMQVGEKLSLFSGDNQEHQATIASVHKKKVVVTIESTQRIDRESPCEIHLGQAISKGERMEWVLQKAVELGVSSITPILTSRSVVRLNEARLTKKTQQWQSIAIAACEQSGRNTIPKINKPCALDYYLQATPMPFNFVLDPSAQKSWRDYTLGTGGINLLIGPEGGLSDVEISLAKSQKFMPLSLGPRVLRTETAAIAALSILQAICGDL